MPETIKELIDKELNKTYAKAAGPMLSQIAAISNATNSPMQQSLTKLDQAAYRLEDEGMKADDAQLQQTLGVYRDTAITTQSLILANDDIIQNTGAVVAIPAVTAKVFQAITSAIVASGRNPVGAGATRIFTEALVDVPWNIPSAVDFAGGYVRSEAWIGRMNGWGAGYADLTESTLLSGIEQGWGPKKIANEMRLHAENIPLSAAENLTRTLQLTSYRDAALAMETENSDFITKKIRIASLDDRTCLTCISLHGTELELGERPDDHYRGRCDVFYQVPGGPQMPDQMQADSKPGQRNFVPYQNGEDWFASLPASRQAQQASFLNTPAKLRAYQDGTPLSSFVGDHVDDVFGAQKVELSLIKALGDSADPYYQVNQ